MANVTQPAPDAPLSDEESLSERVLHRSQSVRIYDVRCRPHDFARGREECTGVDQIVFPRHGLFERETRGERAIADLNQVLFFNAHEPYRIAHPAGCGDDCTVFVYDAGALREALSAVDPARAEAEATPFRFAQALSDARAFAAQAALRRAALGSPADTLAIDESALRLLHYVTSAGYRGQGMEARPARRATWLAHQATARATCLLLAQRFREELSLEAIARAVHSSPFHLARLFREHVGLSIHQYRLRLRLREALARVAEGEQNLARLALELGFASHSHLSDSFRTAFGEAPASYRRLDAAQRLHALSRKLELG